MIITYSVGFYCFDWPIALCLPVSEGLSAWPIHFNGTLTEVLCDAAPPSIPPRGLVRMMVGYRLGIDWRKVEPNGIKYPIDTRYRPLFNPIKSAREGLRSIQQPLPSIRHEAPSACGLGSNPTSLEQSVTVPSSSTQQGMPKSSTAFARLWIFNMGIN